MPVTTTSPDDTLALEPITDHTGTLWEIRIGDGTIPPWGMPPTNGVAIMRNGVQTNGVAIQIKPENGGIAYFLGRNGNWWTSSAFNVWDDVGPDDPAKPVAQPPPVTGTIPTSLTFVPFATDPAAATNEGAGSGARGYGSLRPNLAGELILFGSANGHDSHGYNGIDKITSKGIVNLRPHTTVNLKPATAATNNLLDGTGLNFMMGRDNQSQVVLPNGKLYATDGEREPGVFGNFGGVADLNAAGAPWQITDVFGAMPGVDGTVQGKLEDGASARIDALGIAVIYGSFNNAQDFLQIIAPNPVGSANPYRSITFANPDLTTQFPGSRHLRTVAGQNWPDGTQLRIYGGLAGDTPTSHYDLFAVELADVLTGGPPRGILISTNTLPAGVRLEGEGLIAMKYPLLGGELVTNGVLANWRDIASGAWSAMTVTNPAPIRIAPFAGGSAPFAAYSSALNAGVVMWANGAIELMALSSGVVVPPPPPPIDPPPPPPPPPPPSSLTPGVGTRRITTTAFTLPAAIQQALYGKHMDLANVGSDWYLMFGDHKSDSAGEPLDSQGHLLVPDADDGNEQRYKVNFATMVAVKIQNYFKRAAAGVDPDTVLQGALPDDGGLSARGREVLTFPSERVDQSPTRTTTVAGVVTEGCTERSRRLYGANIAVQNMESIYATNVDTGVDRVVLTPRPHCMRGDKLWRMAYDPQHDFHFGIVNNGGDVSVFKMGYDANNNGVDLTQYNPGTNVPAKWNWDSTGLGQITAHVAGMAINWVARLVYFYDHITTILYRWLIDGIFNNSEIPVALAQFSSLGQPLGAGDQSTIKLAFYPGVGVVLNGIGQIIVYEPGAHVATVQARQDGWIGGNGNRVPTSTTFFDNVGVQKIISIGGIDNQSNNPVGNNQGWMIEIT